MQHRLITLLRQYKRRPAPRFLGAFLHEAAAAAPLMTRAERRELAIAFRDATGWELSFAAAEPRL